MHPRKKYRIVQKRTFKKQTRTLGYDNVITEIKIAMIWLGKKVENIPESKTKKRKRKMQD